MTSIEQSNYLFHPLAELFPLIEGQEFEELIADIREHGVREPIWIYDGQIIDGRNRYRASAVASVDCPMREYMGDDPASFVVSLNLKRRHLSESQRAMVAAKLANWSLGDNQYGSANLQTQTDAATLLNVSPRTVATAKVVQKDGAPELIAAVEQGKVSVSAAADVATKPKEEQREIVARGEREILEAAKTIRSQKAEARLAERLVRNERIRANNAALPVSERKYSVILADPPWSYESDFFGDPARGVADHYPTMTASEIEALPIAQMAADDCALLLWATLPLLPQAIATITAWGFEYKTVAFVWVKTNRDGEGLSWGLGNWTRANAEIVLLATKGAPPRLNADVHQVVMSPRMEHSRKPEEVAERIERLVPGPYLELFARRPRDGWDVWGNQSGAAHSREG